MLPKPEYSSTLTAAPIPHLSTTRPVKHLQLLISNRAAVARHVTHLSTTRMATTVQATLTAPMMTVLSSAALAPEPVLWNSSVEREAKEMRHDR
jgi:hypothetical protein